MRVEKLNGGSREAAGDRRQRGLPNGPLAWTSACSTPSRPPAERDCDRRVPRAAACRAGPAPIGSTTGTPLTAATRRAPSAISCCRRCMRCTSRRDGSARAALNYIARRLTIPPADVYGVATFYALFSIEPRAPRVLHVCDDVVCRCAGSEALIATLTEQVGPRAPTSTGRAGCRARAWGSATGRRRRC